MFLIRAAFWLSIVILLIPADPQSGEAPRVTLFNAFIAARTTLADLSGFCDRNPDVCVTGGAAVDLFADKAQNGVRMLYRYFDENGATDPAKADDHGTLSRDDLVLPWHDPKSDKAV